MFRTPLFEAPLYNPVGQAHKETWLSLGQVRIDDICRWFSAARSYRKAASLLNIREHPEILKRPMLLKRGGPAKLKPILTDIFYGCAMDDMYRSLKGPMKVDTTAKGDLLSHALFPTCSH